MEERRPLKGLKIPSLQESLLKECRVMTEYCIANGKALDAHHILVLEKDDKDIKASELMPVYNYLLTLVKPAKPGTLVLFEKNRQSNSPFRFLGPLPIVRRFMLVTIISLVALILISLSPHVNASSIELSMLQGEGWDQVQRLAFLLAAASVGASFYALFKMNSYIKKGTFDMKFAATYWSRYVLGLVAGILLSELFIVLISTSDTTNTTLQQSRGLSEDSLLNTARFLLKPILAILGGFSANLVYRILNRFIEGIESIFRGSVEDAVNMAEQAVLVQAQEMESNLRANTAQSLIALKNELVNTDISKATLAKMDTTISALIQVPLSQLSEEIVEKESDEDQVVEPVHVDVDVVQKAIVVQAAPEEEKKEEEEPEEPEAPANEDKETSQTTPTASW